MDRLNNQLFELKEELRKKRKWQHQLEDYKDELSVIEEKIEDLTKQLKVEAKDVEKLGSLSFQNLVQTLIGKKDEKLEEEKQEVIAVQVKLEEAKKTKKEIESEIKTITTYIEKIGNIENQYNQLFSEKERILKQQASSSVEKLDQFSEKKAALKTYVIELEEALTAGRRVEVDLESAMESLNSAANWGTFDMFGGGAISGLMKHSHIDEATDTIHQAQKSMRQFQKELVDVKESLDIHIDMSGMLKFADFFFDGFLTDYLVQEKINDSLDEVVQKKAEIRSLLSQLEIRVEKTEGELEQVEVERKRFIEEY